MNSNRTNALSPEKSKEAKQRIVDSYRNALSEGKVGIAESYKKSHPWVVRELHNIMEQEKSLHSTEVNTQDLDWLEDKRGDGSDDMIPLLELSDDTVIEVTSTDWLANPFYDNEDGDASCKDTEQQDLSVPKGDGEQEVMFAQLREKLSMPEDDHVEGRTRYANMERLDHLCFCCLYCEK